MTRYYVTTEWRLGEGITAVRKQRRREYESDSRLGAIRLASDELTYEMVGGLTSLYVADADRVDAHEAAIRPRSTPA